MSATLEYTGRTLNSLTLRRPYMTAFCLITYIQCRAIDVLMWQSSREGRSRLKN